MTDRWALAIDIGGTKVEGALVDDRGAVLGATRCRAGTGGERSAAELDTSVLQVVDGALDRAAAAGVADGSIVGVGVGVAGPIDERAGTVSPINLPAWHEHPLRAVIAARVAERLPGVPLEFHRDGVAIALAAHWTGAAHGVANMIGMVISTGIGGGIILDGRVVTGNAGHIGQIEVSGATGELSLGSRTTLESVASGPHTVAWARGQGWPGTTGEELAAAFAAGDDVAVRAVERLAALVGQGVCSAAALLDIEVVAIGGGFSRVAPDLIDRIGAHVARHPLDYVSRVRVIEAGLEDEAPLAGAAAFVHLADRPPAAR
ncbi:MAG: ROK family protein [Corynebacteriales bacterium]|nr:ROK family protein [Mycobacteriales bacterium]